MDSLRFDNLLELIIELIKHHIYDYSFIIEKHTNQNWTKEEMHWEESGAGGLPGFQVLSDV